MSVEQITLGVARPEDRDAIAWVLHTSLSFSLERAQHFIQEELRIEQFRVARQGTRLIACVALIEMGHWFGGALVPAVGISGVGVLPNARASGVGRQLIRAAVKEIHTQGAVLSSLYPATVAFYALAGYARAGTRTTYVLPLDAIEVAPQPADPALSLVPFGEEDYPTIAALYTEYARTTAGLLDRPSWVWQRVLHPYKRSPQHYMVVDEASQPQGYIVLSQNGDESELIVYDMCAPTGAVVRRLLAFLRAHRSVNEAVRWRGTPHDPLVYALREPLIASALPRARIDSTIDWMLRLVDAPAALMARGYPTGVQADLHFAVSDDVLPANNGPFVLQVRDGRGVVERGGEGHIALDIRDLAALYSGFLTPAELAHVGTLRATPTDLARAGAVFAGPPPWLPDVF